MKKSKSNLLVISACLMALTATVSAAPANVQTILRTYCLNCHSTEKQKGDLDLEASDIQKEPHVWENVLDQMQLGEMPPKKEKQLSTAEKKQLTDWVRGTLDQIALANAGDPGPVVLRRLSNMEYTYTLRDLTGVESLDPAKEFPVDGAAGEGFSNAGAALVMSPALLTKYLDAAKDVANHMVLLEDGVRFSAGNSPQEWTDEILKSLRRYYARHTSVKEVVNEVGGTGKLKSAGGGIPIARYLDALQGRGSADGLSAKYLDLLKQSLTAKERSVLLDPMRQKFQSGNLTAADIESWQNVLWRFNPVGHIGRPNGPKLWQEPVTPLVAQQEFRVALEPGKNTKLFLVAGPAGDGGTQDEVLWDNPRLVAKGRPDFPLANLPELIKHLETQRTKLLADAEACLNAMADGNENAPKDSLAAWRAYLGFGDARLEPLLSTKVEEAESFVTGKLGKQVPESKKLWFIKGWRDQRERDLAVWANSSDTAVRIPGVMKPHSVATHPTPKRESVIAWKSPASTTLRIAGEVTPAHPECGNGVTWALELRRGSSIERLASGVAQGASSIPFGPFDNVPVNSGHVVAIVIGPRDGNHSCDLTAIQITLTTGEKTWDLARDVSPDILAGNPHGPWHFLSQPVSPSVASDAADPVVAWHRSPSAATAVKVREHLAKDFPLTHPLLATALKSFRPASSARPLATRAPSVLAVEIPGTFGQGVEFVVTGRLAAGAEASVQLQVLKEKPHAVPTSLLPGLPVIVSDDSTARRRFESGFAAFRALFPAALCYSSVVPIDEVVTLSLYHREDEPLRRLMLTDTDARELDRLWDELRYVSEAPLKQVDALEQLYQYATQDRPGLVKEFGPMREPTMQRAEAFKKLQIAAEPKQVQAVLDFANQAWRRPLSDAERNELRAFYAKLRKQDLPHATAMRLMLARVLTSPAFLYRGEKAAPGLKAAPVNDWELATRLSYFLWSSAPDAELAQLAATGKLRDPDVLAAQAKRILKDERVRRLATEFGCQWLHVRDVAALDEKSERHFPTFLSVRESMQEEVTRFFTDFFQRNGSVLSLLAADHTFVNGPLAEHYGMKPGGAGWQRVERIRDQGRGGMLGFAATLAKQAGASRTSGILRGAWLCEVVLGEKLPIPPKGVPVLPEQPPEGLTERQLIEKHSTDANCAGCHRRIDPFGFALEGFDAIGRTRKANTKVTLPDGSIVEGLDGLRTYLLEKRRDDFLRQFCRKLLGYALGRGVQISDKPLIAAMLTQLNGGDHNVGAAVELIVRSPQFREVRGREFVAHP